LVVVVVVIGFLCTLHSHAKKKVNLLNIYSYFWQYTFIDVMHNVTSTTALSLFNKNLCYASRHSGFTKLFFYAGSSKLAQHSVE
jgi:hypothetical protein